MTYALFSASEPAHRAVDALRQHGVRDHSLSIVDGSRLDDTHATDRAYGTDRGGAAPSTDPTHAAPASGAVAEGGSGSEAQNSDAKKTQLAAGGLAVAALGAGLLVPGLGIILGAGALATSLAGELTKASGAPESGSGIATYLRSQNLPDSTIETISDELASGGAVVQIDTVDAGLTEAQILQIVSEYGGRIAWDLGNSLTHSPTANHP